MRFCQCYRGTTKHLIIIVLLNSICRCKGIVFIFVYSYGVSVGEMRWRNGLLRGNTDEISAVRWWLISSVFLGHVSRRLLDLCLFTVFFSCLFPSSLTLLFLLHPFYHILLPPSLPSLSVYFGPSEGLGDSQWVNFCLPASFYQSLAFLSHSLQHWNLRNLALVTFWDTKLSFFDFIPVSRHLWESFLCNFRPAVIWLKTIFCFFAVWFECCLHFLFS